MLRDASGSLLGYLLSTLVQKMDGLLKNDDVIRKVNLIF
jgi:hypothetical protein